MNLAVIVLNWNRYNETQSCVLKILEWKNLSPVIWIVDNASNDSFQLNELEKHAKVRIIRSDVNCGFAGGNNIAIKEFLNQDYDAVLLLNNDARILEENAEILIHTFQLTPGLGVLGPVLQEENNHYAKVSLGGKDISKHIYSRLFISHEDLQKYRQANPILEVDYVPGTIALIRTNVFKEIGLLDEDYFFSGEIADFCERAKKAGYSCAIDLKSTAEHKTDMNNKLRDTLYLYYILRNRFLFIRKFRRQKLIFLYSLWILFGIAIILKSLFTGKIQSARAAGLALAHGIIGRFGNQNAAFTG